MKDYEIRRIIKLEKKRQNDNLELIASENYASKEVRMAAGSILTNSTQKAILKSDIMVAVNTLMV